jgi:hypothetical protein
MLLQNGSWFRQFVQWEEINMLFVCGSFFRRIFSIVRVLSTYNEPIVSNLANEVHTENSSGILITKLKLVIN